MGDPPLLVVRQRQIETHSSGPIAASGSYRGPQIATFLSLAALERDPAGQRALALCCGRSLGIDGAT